MHHFASVSSLNVTVFFSLLAGLLYTFAFFPYISDTLAKKTQPQRASWFIWSLLSSISFASQYYEGATGSLWFAGAATLGTLIVTLLSIRYGVGGMMQRGDCLVLAAAAVGLVLWYLSETAVYALAICITISLLAGTTTVIKAYRAPHSETMVMWSLSFIASICAIIGIGTLDWVLLAYPLYLFVLNGAIVAAMVLGGRYSHSVA